MLFLTLLKEASPKPFGFLLIFSRGCFCSSPSQQRGKTILLSALGRQRLAGTSSSAGLHSTC